MRAVIEEFDIEYETLKFFSLLWTKSPTSSPRHSEPVLSAVDGETCDLKHDTLTLCFR
jgi:hypothetical protein